MEKLTKGTQLYGYIASNYYKMEKEELKNLFLDFMFIATENMTEKEMQELYNKTINEFNDEREF